MPLVSVTMQMLKTMRLIFITLLGLLAFSCGKSELPVVQDYPGEVLRILESPCGDINTLDYPNQLPDDYLHEERFTGLEHVVIFDHIATRKMVNVFLPTLDNPDANLCGVDLWVKNPQTGQTHRYKDIFNWEGNGGIFNLNEELSALWGFHSSDGVVSFPCHLKHMPTGLSYDFEHEDIAVKFFEL